MARSGTSPATVRPRLETAGRFGAAIGLVALANASAWAAGPALGGANLAMAFLAPVLITAIGFGLGPALAAAVAAAISFNYLFLEPRFTFQIESAADLLTFSMFFAVAMTTGWLAGRARDQALAARRHAAAVGALLEASRALSAATTAEEVAQALAEQVTAVGAGAAVVLTPAGEGLAVVGHPAGLERLAPEAEATARLAFETGAPQPTSPTADGGRSWRFLPLEGSEGRLGVVGLRGTGGGETGGLIDALLQQGAVAMERAALATAAAENQGLRRADELRSALLNSISHDFRTPLSTVLGAATTLLDFEAQLEPAVRRDLLDSIKEQALRLNRYVGDLLDMARLEARALKPRKDWTDVRPVIASALARLGDRIGNRRVVRDFASDLSRLRLDATLLEQAVLNILENAITYGPDGSRIEIAAYEDAGRMVIAIEDEGPGLPPEALKAVFEKFRRLQRGSDRGEGLGLGLSIAKGFIEAIGGSIAATSPVADGRGARFLISLPKAVRTPRALM